MNSAANDEDPLAPPASFSRTLIESFPELVFLISEDGRMLRWNRHLEQVTGYAEAEVAAMHPVAFFPAEEHTNVEAAIEAVFARGSARVEATILTREGERLPHLLSGQRVEMRGEPVLCGFAIDISQRRHVEQELTESRRFLETLVDNLPGTVYRCRNDPDWTMYFISEACTSLMGYTPGEMMAPGYPTLGELIHDDDRQRVWDTVQDALKRHEPFRITYRLGHRDGGSRWVWEQGRGVFSADGALEGLEGFITDITDQKQAQDDLQRLADRLHTTLESITDAFITLDREWRFTYANREAERVLEQPGDSLTGKVFQEVLPDLRGSSLEAKFQRALEDGVSLRFEYYRQASGRWHEFHVYPSDEGLTAYFRDSTREKKDREQIEFLALYDPVTHLPNRRLLEDRLDRVLASRRRSASRAALLFIDLDNFKSVNDAFGHDQGDALLQQVARRLEECLRRNDTIARFGGDEFAVVLEGLAAQGRHAGRDVQQIATKIGATLAQPYRLGDQTCHTSASIGIVEFGEEETTPGELLKRADLAMYRAKNSGRNTSRVFEPAMQTAAATRMQLETDLRAALEHGEIDVHYQTQIDAEGRITGAEALARWWHAERGAISPADFIPLAEQTGLIVPLGRAIMDAACRQLARWREDPPTPGFTIGINVSARQFHEPRFVEDVLAAIERTGSDPYHLRLELTESMLLEDMEASMRTMARLKTSGIRFSLDDFGTGYSSLAYLKNLPLDRLKIDQTFVRDMATSPNDAAIVNAIIGIADSLGLEVVAEGVETEVTRQRLAELGCYQYQGYLFGRPVPAAEFEALIRGNG